MLQGGLLQQWGETTLVSYDCNSVASPSQLGLPATGGTGHTPQLTGKKNYRKVLEPRKGFRTLTCFQTFEYKEQVFSLNESTVCINKIIEIKKCGQENGRLRIFPKLNCFIKYKEEITDFD